MTAEEFERRFTSLVVKAMTDAQCDAEMRAAIFEIQARCLGRGIALVCGGNSESMGAMLEAAMHYMETEASGMVNVAAFLAEVKNGSRNSGA